MITAKTLAEVIDKQQKVIDYLTEQLKIAREEMEFRKSGMIGYRNKAKEYRLAAEDWMKKYDELKNKHEPEILIES